MGRAERTNILEHQGKKDNEGLVVHNEIIRRGKLIIVLVMYSSKFAAAASAESL